MTNSYEELWIKAIKEGHDKVEPKQLIRTNDEQIRLGKANRWRIGG